MEQKENILGTEKIGKLIRKFSIPCIISLVVNSLYNIVDQIFIGWGVGYLGNGATNIIFPLTMICLAFALMFGDGASTFLGLKLGEKKNKEAKKGVGNGIVLSVIVAILFAAFTLAFLPKIINIFGCTDALRSFALEYGYIIALGIPFMMIGTTLNSIIRTDGNPKFAMFTMVLGAILNIILDPIFIFVFNMGVAGAAWATIISQFATFIINILYIRKFKSIKLEKEDFKLNFNISKNVVLLGISSFITQMSVVIVIGVENNLLNVYGPNSKYGTEIAITVIGIVMKINQIINSIVLGVAIGAQPIFGYNYGAGKFDRVKKTLKIVIILNVIISSIAFILFQTIPDKLISIFGSGDALYSEFACLTFRIFLMFTILNSIQVTISIFFQAIGKGVKSALLSLSRQILFLIPIILILCKTFGVMGVLYSSPVADLMAFVIATVLLIVEVKHLKNSNENKEILENNISNNKDLNEHVIITINREYGSGGRYIGKLVADKLGINLYDKNLISQLSEKTGLSAEYIECSEESKGNLDYLNSGYYFNLSNEDELFILETKMIKEIAEKESCVFVGRCADYILKDEKNIINIFIYSDIENKINRVVKRYDIPLENAEKEIKRIDKLRENHYKYYTGNSCNNPSNYDLCINSDKLGVELTADVIEAYISNNKKHFNK